MNIINIIKNIISKIINKKVKGFSVVEFIIYISAAAITIYSGQIIYLRMKVNYIQSMVELYSSMSNDNKTEYMGCTIEYKDNKTTITTNNSKITNELKTIYKDNSLIEIKDK